MSLNETLERIRLSPVPQNEESAKFYVLAPILRDLGWDPHRPEVSYEHPVGGGASGRVDIALRGPRGIVAMIEAKAPASNLGNHVTQVLGYAFHDGVDICVLTTGLEWWLYLPRESGEPAKRRFAVLNLQNDPLEQLSDDLNAFLSKETLVNGLAVKRAQSVLKASLETAELNTKIPGIWANMVNSPDEELVELLSKRVYEGTNLRPAREQVVEALQRSPQPSSSVSDSQAGVSRNDALPPSKMSKRKQRPIAIELWGHRYSIQMWKDVTCTVAEKLYDRHPHEFHKILELEGSKHPYAARDPKVLKNPKRNGFSEVGSTGYYIDIHLSSENHVKRAELFLDCFGYPPSELKIKFE